MGEWDPGVESESMESLDAELEAVFEQRRHRRVSLLKGVAVVIGLLALAALVNTIRNVNPQRLDQLHVGGEARVISALTAAVDAQAWEEMLDLQAARDDVGLNLMMGRGRAFLLSAGTRVRVLETDYGSAVVVSLEGRTEGKVGRVPTGRLQPQVGEAQGPPQ